MGELGEFEPEVMGGILVINDKGEEELISPGRYWEWQQDARQDAVTVDEFEAAEGDKLHGTSH